MLNKNNSTQQPKQPQNTQPSRKPNEQASFHLSGSIKIFDPKSGEVLLKMRAD